LAAEQILHRGIALRRTISERIHPLGHANVPIAPVANVSWPDARGKTNPRKVVSTEQRTNMPQHLIFLPMRALAFLTFLVLLLIPFRRFRAGFAGRVTAEDFRFGESARVPGDVSIPNRNYMNLLEMPMLFYVVCLMLYVSHRVQPGFMWLAWTYV